MKHEYVITMVDVSNRLKYPPIKKTLCLTLTLALLLMMFLPVQQSSAADPIGASYSVNGRRLSAALAGDNSDWIEIAQYTHTDGTSYSLIVRENYINTYAGSGRYGDPTWQYTPYSSPLSTNYLNSGCRVRNAINNWFNNRATGPAVDNLPTNAPLRSYTVQNTAANTLGTASTPAGLTNGFSKPTTTQIRTGEDIAFALSYGEAATFLSKTHFARGMNPETQTSNTFATANYGKITIPQIYGYGMWLRSPGDIANTAGCLDYTGRAFQFYIDPTTTNERGLVYPALWVQSSIFPSSDVGYVVHYYLEGTTISVAPDKTGTGKAGSSVTESAIDISGYSALAPTSLTKTITTSGTEFIFYYTYDCPVDYVVHYYLAGTTTKIASDKTVSGQTLGASITEYAIAISGYNPVAPTSLTKTLGASGNEFVFYYTVNSNNDVPTVVDGRVLTPSMTGDKVNWIEIARYGDYSLIVRTNYLNIYPQASCYGNPEWQYTTYGTANTYGNSVVRDKINAWFNGAASPVADNLAANARLRDYTVKNNALNVLGTSSNVASLTNGFSTPTSNHIGTGNDIAFALSYSESAEFLSKTHDVRGMNPQVQPSNTNATLNFGKITIPQMYAYGMWLRSPGDLSYTAGDLDYTGRTFQFQINPNGNSERGLVYPALWVNSSIFETTYTVHYYLAGSTISVATDKVVSGQIGSLVTENAIAVAGYTALAPTSISKTLTASGNEFVFYYCARSDLGYVVNYLEQGSDKVLAAQKVVDGQVFGSQVTEVAVDIAGYNKVAPISATITIGVTGNVINFYYSASDDDFGTIGYIRKTVDGIAFDVWITGYGGNVAELISGMHFTLYKVNADGTINYANIVATGELDADSGMIIFDTPSLLPGQYAVVESFTGSAANVFEVADPLYIWIGADGKMIAVTDFDSNAMYWSTDAFYRSKGTADLAINYVFASSSTVMRNPWCNDFQTKQYNPATGSYGVAYSSFCGYYDSGKLGGDTYNGPTLIYVDMTSDFAALKPGVKEGLITAYNYIYDTWGSLDQWPSASGTSTPSESTKFIAQLVTWLLLNDGIVEANSDFAYINDCVAEVLANYQGYSGSQTIKDIVFLADENYPNNLQYCQPQIIPIYGEPVFNNKAANTQGISIAKTVDGIAFDVWTTGYDGDVDELISGMDFKLYTLNADGTINYANVIATGVLNVANGMIDFNIQGLSAGKYAIVETLTGKAADVFVAVAPLYIYISETGEVIEYFDYDVDYFVSWNWFNAQGRVGLTGVPTDYYYITEVWNIETRTAFGNDYTAYTSFCADGTSRTFAETDRYKVGQLDQETYDNILAALNYIHNKYGSVDAWQGNTGPITVKQSTKVLSQMVIWTLIHDDVALQGMRVAEAGYNADEFAVALQDVMDNYVGSSGAVKSLVYLVGYNFPSDIVSHQPQIIPLFGDPVFNNISNSC